MDATSSKLILTCADGYLLDAILFTPVHTPKAFVIFQGGTAIKKEFYTYFCQYLCSQGLYVLSYDYRGIGGSRHGSLKGMKASLLDWGRLDMEAAILYSKTHFPALASIVVGHSIGTQLIGFAPSNHLLQGVIGIASSTGTWWKMKRPRNLSAALLWYLINPILTPLFGYAPLKKLGIMEDLPRNVINQWSRWCRSSFYFGSHFGKSLSRKSFYPLKVPFTVHYFSDDYIATDDTVTDLLSLYSGTKTRMIKHRPHHYDTKRVGHFGVFSRKFKDSFWQQISGEVQAMAERVLQNP